MLWADVKFRKERKMKEKGEQRGKKLCKKEGKSEGRINNGQLKGKGTKANGFKKKRS